MTKKSGPLEKPPLISALALLLISTFVAFISLRGDIAARLPAGGSAPPPVESVPETDGARDAQPADDFVNSLAVNTHLGYDDTAYRFLRIPGPSGNTILSTLLALGIRHIRDGGMESRPELCPSYRSLIQRGISVDAISSPSTDDDTLKRIVSCLGDGLFAIEGPNELDRSGQLHWAEADVRAMAFLRARSGIAFPRSVKLYGPSVTTESAYEQLAAVDGDVLLHDVDYANAHIYFSARQPETQGWGPTDRYGTYGAITTTRNWAVAIASPGKPWVSTETGYPDADSDNHYVPPAVKARYIVRDLLKQWQAGAQFIAIYELAQEHGSWGLLDENLKAKPAYTAVQSLIATLADPGPGIPPDHLRYRVTANGDVERVLFKKRNGSFWLCLWQDDQAWNPVSGLKREIRPTTATIDFALAPRRLTRHQIDPADGTISTTHLEPLKSQTIDVTDSVEIVEIWPAS